MTEQTNAKPNLYALLIGIDYYLPNELPDGTSFSRLEGCVRDVSHVEAFLVRELGMQKESILKLTASSVDGITPSESCDQWPTYENVVAAFDRLREMTKPDDSVYIHYSGHGGRASTIFPELKGENGLDEALVPMDIGDSEGRYLRDVELAKLLDQMVKKGLIVSVVLDSCHSGGMTRGMGDTAVRGISPIDTSPRSTESLVGTREELIELWNQLTGGATRGVKLGSGWLPEPREYVLLAACRASESAYEYAFDGKERNGVLTYWLLDSLQDIRAGLSYKVLHDRILAKVRSQFEGQTPQLQGEGDRIVFGSNRARPHYAVPVMRVDPTEEKVLLNAGQAHGLRKKARFAIYPHGMTDFSLAKCRQALAEISELGATDSWAVITKRFGKDEIKQGAQAVLIGAGSVRLISKIGLVTRDELGLGIDQGAVMRAVEQALMSSGWVEVARDNKQVAYQVALNENGEYEIWDCTGQPIANLPSALKADDPSSAVLVAHHLVHLAKFHAVQRLSNHDPLSPLAGKLIIELMGKRQDYDPLDPFEPQPFDHIGPTPILTVGEWTALRIRNAASKVLNITVFDLQPGWGISQIYPSGQGDYFVSLDPEQEIVLPLLAELPAGYCEGTDVIKVFATVAATSFRWLELPRLDEPFRSPTIPPKAPRNSLEELLTIFVTDRPPMRNLVPAAYPSREWVTAQVEVGVQRSVFKGDSR